MKSQARIVISTNPSMIKLEVSFQLIPMVPVMELLQFDGSPMYWETNDTFLSD